MPKIQKRKTDGYLFITIPKELAEQLGWKAGDRIDMRFNQHGRIEFFPLKAKIEIKTNGT